VILAHRAAGGVPSLVFGSILLACAAGMLVLIGITLVRGRQHLLVARAGVKMHLRGSMRPAKFQRLVTQIITRIREVQAGLAAAAAADAGAADLTPPVNATPEAGDMPVVEPSPGASEQ
jgi:hypothetical protein